MSFDRTARQFLGPSGLGPWVALLHSYELPILLGTLMWGAVFLIMLWVVLSS